MSSEDPSPPREGQRLALYRLLLGLAGRIPDSEMAHLRMGLADDERGEMADRLAAMIGSGQCDPAVAEHEAVRDLLEREGRSAPSYPVAVPAARQYRFAGGRFDADPELVEGEQLRHKPADRAVVEAVCRVGETIAIWRVYRGGDGPASDRVYLCEARSGADVVEMTAEAQFALEEIGEKPARVEIFHEDELCITDYHDQALAAAVLLWAADTVPVRLARVFDGAQESGPYFTDDHHRLTGPDREQVLTYLRSATPVLGSLGRMDDVVRPERVANVPVDFRSDRVWVWTEAVAYYLAEYDLAPEPDLISHILGGPPPIRTLGRFDRQRVTAALFAPAEKEPVWQAG
ncbi:hypothetical protein [Kineosporia sp. NBRC 101731]|uniref:hypothetical protein n=1 Tax=Kineosporia sp. NBRC 101731 TaxID=3032199 RepID=UPI0024A4DCB1|nr:hypothetical protein [Kineosporia sp. NBRC 101731]GLY28928.1 hypothetical protein Kisp02_22930 [Kineosporia sp. NBRC 101731]